MSAQVPVEHVVTHEQRHHGAEGEKRPERVSGLPRTATVQYEQHDDGH